MENNGIACFKEKRGEGGDIDRHIELSSKSVWSETSQFNSIIYLLLGYMNMTASLFLFNLFVV